MNQEPKYNEFEIKLGIAIVVSVIVVYLFLCFPLLWGSLIFLRRW